MSPRLRLITAARDLRAARQGSLDGLCGLYVIINAIQVAIYPSQRLKLAQLRQLFEAGIAALSRLGLRRVVSDGVTEDMWRRLCAAVIAEAGRMLDGKLVIVMLCAGRDPLDARDMIRRVKRSLRDGNPVMITLGGRYNHWTVAVGYSATRLTLFDSASCSWVMIRSIGAGDGRSTKLHQIARETIVAIRFEPSSQSFT